MAAKMVSFNDGAQPSTPVSARDTQETVAVVIAAKNAADSIGRAVTSALAQSDVTQIFVVDDASTDETAKAAQACDDGSARLTVIRLPRNLGPAGARNAALKQITADWFTILDADDYMDADRISRLLAASEHKHDFIADDLWLIPEDDETADRQAMWSRQDTPARLPLTLHMLVDQNLPRKGLERRELGFLKPLLRMSRIRKMAISYDERMRLGEDIDLYIRMLADGAPALLTAPMGYVAVRRRNSLSASHGHRELSQYYRSACDLETLPGLSDEERMILAKSRTAISKRYRWSKLINAIKTKSPLTAISCFYTSPNVMAHLVGELFNALFTRLGRSQSSD